MSNKKYHYICFENKRQLVDYLNVSKDITVVQIIYNPDPYNAPGHHYELFYCR